MPLAFKQRMRPTTRRTLECSMRHRPPVTRELRRRQLPTVTSHAVPTGEYQSDPPSLPTAIRCSTSRGSPTPRTGRLTRSSISVRTSALSGCGAYGNFLVDRRPQVQMLPALKRPCEAEQAGRLLPAQL